MLENIQNTLVAIGDFFVGVGQFVSDFIQDLISFVENLATIGEQITTLFGGLPVYFLTGIAGLVVIMVLLRVLGRD